MDISYNDFSRDSEEIEHNEAQSDKMASVRHHFDHVCLYKRQVKQKVKFVCNCHRAVFPRVCQLCKTGNRIKCGVSHTTMSILMCRQRNNLIFIYFENMTGKLLKTPAVARTAVIKYLCIGKLPWKIQT